LLNSSAKLTLFQFKLVLRTFETMSTETKEDVEMLIEGAEEEDEYLMSFEAIETSTDESKIADYQTLLLNPRYDEKAVKIKEQCIYRYVVVCKFFLAACP